MSGFVYADNDTPEKPGDNLDLDAVLNLFEKSKSVEDFEKRLNEENNDVNNLDLNEDGYVDYIRVIDYADGNTHSLTLQVPYSNEEAQDVAVIMLEEQGDGSVVAQIAGDEDLYGEDYIVEPGDEGSEEVVDTRNWAPVRHIYQPSYVVWVSPWRFGFYPRWYRPWRPVRWSVYRAYPRAFHRPFRRTRIIRAPRCHKHYRVRRVHSVTFHTHHVVHHKSGGKKTKTVTKTKGTKSNPGNATQKKQQKTVTKKNTGTKTKGQKTTQNKSTTKKTKGQKSTKTSGQKKVQQKQTRSSGGTKKNNRGGNKSGNRSGGKRR